MDIHYFMKIQNAYGTKNKREKELIKVNTEMSRHFEDTFDTDDVLINGKPFKLMIIKDTDGNTHKKKIKSKHNDKFNLGDYIEWHGQYWLVTLLDPDDKTWNKGYMYLCNILLRFQNKEGKIIERWAYSEDFTKYSNGIENNRVILKGDYQYGITLAVDKETKFIKRDYRFPIDLDEVEPPDVYRVTNRKIFLTDASSFSRGGILTLTLSFDAFNAETDKQIELKSGSRVWLCDYYSPTSASLPSIPGTSDSENIEQNHILSKIEYRGKPEVVAGGNAKSFTGTFYNDKNALISQEGTWEIIAIDELLPYIHVTTNGNTLKLKVDNNELTIGGKIRIIFSHDGAESSSIDVKVTSGI